MNNGHWIFPEQLGGKSKRGFIYVVVDEFMDKFYIGKKSFWTGDGRESDWRTYMSSSAVLRDMMKERPKADFDYIVLEQYRTVGGLSWAETWSLCHVEALSSRRFYNFRVEKVPNKVNEIITPRHKLRLKETTRC